LLLKERKKIMTSVQNTQGTVYTNGIQQSFKQKVAYMAVEEGFGNASIFMDAMDKAPMRTTMDDLLRETGGQIPDNYECQSMAEKLINFVKGLFAKENIQNTQLNDTVQNAEDETEENTDNTGFSFETSTELE